MTHLNGLRRERLYTDEYRALVGRLGRRAASWRGPGASRAARSVLDVMLDVDVQTYLPDDLLVKMDIATMASSLEARSPLLDHELMEFAASLPRRAQGARAREEGRPARRAARLGPRRDPRRAQAWLPSAAGRLAARRAARLRARGPARPPRRRARLLPRALRPRAARPPRRRASRTTRRGSGRCSCSSSGIRSSSTPRAGPSSRLQHRPHPQRRARHVVVARGPSRAPRDPSAGAPRGERTSRSRASVRTSTRPGRDEQPVLAVVHQLGDAHDPRRSPPGAPSPSPPWPRPGPPRRSSAGRRGRRARSGVRISSWPTAPTKRTCSATPEAPRVGLVRPARGPVADDASRVTSRPRPRSSATASKQQRQPLAVQQAPDEEDLGGAVAARALGGRLRRRPGRRRRARRGCAPSARGSLRRMSWLRPKSLIATAKRASRELGRQRVARRRRRTRPSRARPGSTSTPRRRRGWPRR